MLGILINHSNKVKTISLYKISKLGIYGSKKEIWIIQLNFVVTKILNKLKGKKTVVTRSYSVFITIYIIIQYLKSRVQLVGEICFHMWDGIFTNKPENPIFKEIGLSLAKNLSELS